LGTLVPRTCTVRQDVEAWGQQRGALPLWLEKPGRTRQEPPRRWHGQSVVRRVPVEYTDGRHDVAEIRFLVVHSSQWAHQTAGAYAAAQAKAAEHIAEHVQHVEARWFACAADAEEAMADYEGRGQGRRGRQPRPWRSHTLHDRVEAVSVPKKRPRRVAYLRAADNYDGPLAIRLKGCHQPVIRTPNGFSTPHSTLLAGICVDLSRFNSRSSIGATA
jgi:hypothetical protein